MSENVLQTLQTAIQDVIAPDVRELKVKLSAHQEQTKTQYESLQEQMKLQHESLHEQILSASQKADAQYKAILAAIAQNKAESELVTVRTIAALSERVAVLEAARH